MGRKDSRFWQSAKNNNMLYIKHYNQLVELAISMFEWKNLPETIDTRYMELSLFRYGKVVFFKDEVLDFLALQCAVGGGFNVYGIPTKRNAIAVNGYRKSLDDKNSVLIYNNMLHTNSQPVIEVYAQRLYDLDIIGDVNCKAQKTPILISCDESERLTMLQIYEKYDGNQPVIFGNKSIQTDAIKVLNTNAPFMANQIQTYKTTVWNEALTYLGISNASFQKKERMITDEMIRSQGGTIASRQGRLEARRSACEEINKMFGLNVEVDFKDDFREVDTDAILRGDTGETNGNSKAMLGQSAQKEGN